MRERRRLGGQVLLALLFVSVGMGVGLALRPASAEPEPMALRRQESGVPRQAASLPRTEAPRPIRDPAQEARIQALEQRVAELTSRAEAAPAAPSTPPARPAPEELRQALLQQQQMRLDAHQRQPIHPTWSSDATRAFSTDFSALTRGQPFSVRSIDCRSTSCIARVEWPSYAEAAASYAVLLQHSYSMDCTRSLLLPDPEDPERAYEASLLLECGNLMR
ncbi:MAG TPA: hypothetical protein VF815_26805 [Myxococcaceae bacterium]|jgi:hypothetical protein